MKRKLTAILLTLTMTMTIALLPATVAFAYTHASGNLTLTLSKTHYDPGEEITATVSGIADNPDSDCCVFLCNPSDPIDKNIDYWWIRDTGTQSRTFAAPLQDGNYEIRLFTSGTEPSASTFVMRVAFTVGNTASSLVMSLNKTSFNVGEQMTITVPGVTQADADKEPAVFLCKPGDAHGKYVDDNWWYLRGVGTVTRNINVPIVNPGTYELRLYSNGNAPSAASFIMKIDITLTGVSAWATDNLAKAGQYDLIPPVLQGADLTKPITRAEFAAVALKLYEKLSGKTSTPAPANTFTDTKDTDILKAYALNVVSGMGNGTFEPNTLLNREQAAVMLTNVYKAVYWENWNRDTAAIYTTHSLDTAGAQKFSDDAKISDWAKESVYFMVKNGIISGMGNNTFAPKNTTDAETAAGYANATREQSLVISVKTYENAKSIKDGSPASGQTAQTPAPAQGGTGNALTLSALSQAAKDAGFIVEDKMIGDDSNGQGPDPTAGFMIGVMNGSTLHLVVYVLEFTSDSDAQSYKNAMEYSEIMDNHTYAYKQFCVEFHSDAYDMENSVMAAFSKAGWTGAQILSPI